MTEYDQNGQVIWGSQQNAGRDINNNIFPKAPWTPPLMLPPRAQSFVGREEDLTWLLQQLTGETGATFALCGPGGMGKTALAAEALHRLIAQEEWAVRFPDGIFYHSFYTHPSLAVAFEELASIFGEEPSGDPRRAAKRAMSCRRALMVFDGAEHLDDTRPLYELGGRNVVLLLSRRRSDAPDHVHRRDLGVLPQEQAIKLLQELSGPRAADRQSVERLVQQIGGYPLALQLIGSYLSSYQEEVADYLRWFEREGLRAVDYGTHHDQSVPVLLQRTYNSLASDEQHVFMVLGLLAPAPFPSELVQEILGLPEQSVQQAIGSLVNLSLLRRPDLGYEVSHPLIHTFAKEHLSSQVYATSSPSSETIAIWQERFLATVSTHFGQSDPYNRIALALWLPHILPLLSADFLTVQQPLRAASLFGSVGVHANKQGKYAEAELLFLRALAIREQQLEASHPSTAVSLSYLAELYLAQGKYAEAEPLFLRALAIREQQLEASHPDTASSLNNLAELYRMQGKYAEAEPLFLRALAIREQQSETSHPSTAAILNNLGILYSAQSKYAEAEPLFLRALTIRKQLLYDLITMITLPDLKQEKYTEAEPLSQQTLAMQEQLWGTMYLDIANSFNNLAALYLEQEKYTEAEPLYQQALTIREQHLGPTHPDTASSLNNLAILYSRQGKDTKSVPLLKRTLEICEQQLSAIHPDTASSLESLAGLYYKQGKYAEAEPLLKRVLAIWEQRLGATHPTTQIAFENYHALLHAIEHQPKLPFNDLTLFKQDIEALIQLFQNHLQDVEFVIDERRIFESAQLEQFATSYQAQSLLARGYGSRTTGENANDQGERVLIELRVSKVIAQASLSTLKIPGFYRPLRKMLWRRRMIVQHNLQALIYAMFFSPLIITINLIHQKIYPILPFLIVSAAGILAVPVFFSLFAFLIVRFHLETRNFLFPGKTTMTQVYYQAGMLSRLVIALTLTIIIDSFLVLLFRLL